MTPDTPHSARQLLLRELSMVSRKLGTVFDARVRSRGLTYARARMLLELARAEGPTQGALSEALGIEQPTGVRQLDAMEAAGLVERRPSEGDRRVKHVFLTPSGRAEAEALLALTGELRDAFCAGVPEAEIARALDVLRAVARNIERSA